jgi:adenylate cyclase
MAQDCKNACKAALEMKSKIEKVNKELKLNCIPAIKIGVGISFGEVIRGKIGSKIGRMDFTVIGDTVNLAARLESFSHSTKKQRIIISSELKELIEKEINTKSVGKIPIKGKKLPVEVYELVKIDV